MYNSNAKQLQISPRINYKLLVDFRHLYETILNVDRNLKLNSKKIWFMMLTLDVTNSIDSSIFKHFLQHFYAALGR